MSIRHLDKDKDVWRTTSKNDPMQRIKIIETLEILGHNKILD